MAQFYGHWDDCQAVHGAAYVSVVMYRIPVIRIAAGEPVMWKRRVAPRATCRECGTRLFRRPGLLLSKGLFINDAETALTQAVVEPGRDRGAILALPVQKPPQVETSPSRVLLAGQHLLLHPTPPTP
ncbi:GFA family protein [Archangium sp.]|uniref:GFA family protein n=1 Tax=Archangium sp. TaxID=1872627 RepID=UPI0039C872B7